MKTYTLLALTLLFSRSSFATSFDLEAVGNQPLYQTDVTSEVYQHSHHDNLRDVTIRNADGELLPYTLMTYEEIHPTQFVGETKPLVIFPLQAGAAGSAESININVAKTAGNTTLNVSSNQLPQAIGGYLFDLGKVHPAVKKLKVDWQGAETKMISMEAYSSSDLKSWSNIGQSVVFKSTVAGQTILQNTIDLYAITQDRYLQIRPKQVNDASFKLTSVSIEYRKPQENQEVNLWQPLKLLNRAEASNGDIHIDFESTGRYPASYLRITLPQQNTITNVQILTRNQADAPWVGLTQAPLYRVDEQGRDTVNPDIKINTTASHYWRLTFSQHSGGIGADNPMLSLGWLPQTIIWNARGKPPYVLAVGETAETSALVSIANLIPNSPLEKIDTLPVANIGAMHVGESVTNPWEDSVDRKRWLLWVGLVLGVLVLAGMAYSLVRASRK